jgi:hypothetical protein
VRLLLRNYNYGKEEEKEEEKGKECHFFRIYMQPGSQAASHERTKDNNRWIDGTINRQTNRISNLLLYIHTYIPYTYRYTYTERR